MKKNGLFFLATTTKNVQPAFVIELLTQLTKVCKDYIGVLNEESLRKNFALIYELIDEILDFGHPQCASTADLQAFVFNEPAVVSASGQSRLAATLKAAPKTMSSKAVHKPVTLRDSGPSGKNEIFVDVIDRISATFNSSGQVRTFAIDGSIQMKSYLSGSPELHLALNDELVISGEGRTGGYGVVELDNVNFHECVQLEKFEQQRMLVLEPPHGEFVLMNFHIGSLRHEGQIPFRVIPVLTSLSEYKLELRLQVRAEFPEKYHGANVKISFTVPKSATGVSVELEQQAKGQTSEYDEATKTVTWSVRKFMGGNTHVVWCKFIPGAGSNPKKEIGPISMNFEIPMYNVSQLQVQHLKILERNKSYNPHRWVRCLTHAESYVCRV